MPTPFRIEVVTTHARFETLRDPWDQLADHHPTPLLRHAWFTAAARRFSPRAELAVVLAWEGERLRAAAPLVQHREGGITRLRLLGFQSDEPEAFLHDDPEALAEVCAAVVRLSRPVVLRRLDGASPELALLQAAHQGRGLSTLRLASTRTHCNPIPRDFAALEAAMAPKKRKEIGRHRKALEQLGALTFDVAAPRPEGVDPLFDAFVALEGAGWKGQAGTALSHDAPQRAFLRDVCASAAAEDRLRFFFLRQDGRPIAAQLHLQCAGKLWTLKIAYDDTLSKYSPGALLTHEVLRHACAHGLTGFEHLGVAEVWQRRWPVEAREHATLRLYPITPSAAVALTSDTLQFVQRRCARSQALPLSDSAAAA
jgi:CelD/BcsL family acetyltransferase involved in cellulose biosynthesis